MFDATIPSSIQSLLTGFSTCFSRASFENFVSLVTGWIACQGRHCITRVIQAAHGPARTKHHSALYRFLSNGKWEPDSLGKVLFRLLAPFLPKQITLILDDTLCHRSGPHIFGAAMHFDAVQSTYGRGTSAGRKGFFAFGHNWVVAAVWLPLPWNTHRGLAIPIVFRLYLSKKRCPQALYRKRTELAQELVELLISWLPPERSLHVVGDSEYSCKTLVKRLPEQVAYTGPVPMDAALYDEPKALKGRGRPRRKGTRLPSPQVLVKQKSVKWKKLRLTIYGREVIILIKSQKCLWYTVAGTTRILMVLTRDPSGRISDRAYFTTDDKLTAAELLIQFARRWEIEVAFRNAKQAMGLQDPQNGWWRRKPGTPRPKKRPGPNPRGTRGEKAVNHTLALSFAAYALVVVWYIKNGKHLGDINRVKDSAPWYRHKDTPSFNDMLAAVRRELWAATFSQHPLLQGVRGNVRELLPHWLLAA